MWFLIFFNVYFWESEWVRERESMSWERAKREGDRIWISLWLIVESLTLGSNSRTVRSWPELKSGAQLTERPKISVSSDRYDLGLNFFQFLYIGVSSPSCGKNPPDCDYKCQAGQLNHFLCGIMLLSSFLQVKAFYKFMCK